MKAEAKERGRVLLSVILAGNFIQYLQTRPRGKEHADYRHARDCRLLHFRHTRVLESSALADNEFGSDGLARVVLTEQSSFCKS